MRPVTPPETRFWRKVRKDAECWIWTAAVNSGGYGSFLLYTKHTVQAHRYSYELHFGNAPPDLCVCHTCDNRLCVRPDHLFLGTKADNAADMVAKHRSPNNARENNPNNKLSTSDVQAIRTLYATGKYRQVDLAERFGVNQTHISAIVRGVLWKL